MVAEANSDLPVSSISVSSLPKKQKMIQQPLQKQILLLYKTNSKGFSGDFNIHNQLRLSSSFIDQIGEQYLCSPKQHRSVDLAP